MPHAPRPSLLCLALGLALVGGCGGGGSARKAESDAPRSGGGAVPVASAPTNAEKRRNKKDTLAGPLVEANQPALPPLPDLVDLATTDIELGAHALVVAREEVASGHASGLTIEQRHAYLFAHWRPQMTEKQAYLQKIQDDRAAMQRRETASAVRAANHEQTLDQTDASWAKQIQDESRKTTPILE